MKINKKQIAYNRTSRNQKPVYIVIHDTGNPGKGANANAHFNYFNGGNRNYIDVLDAQRRYFDAQIGLNNAVRDEHLALVQLYKALGGGWTVEE